MEKLKNLFEKHYKKIFVVLGCALVLTAAFLIQSPKKTDLPEPRAAAVKKEAVDGAYYKGGVSPTPDSTDIPNKGQEIRDSKTVGDNAELSDSAAGTEQKPRVQSSESKNVTTEENGEKASQKCEISVSCAAVLNNMDSLKASKRDIIPENGWILKNTETKINDGESAFDVLERVMRDNKIPMEFSKTPAYNSVYLEGIANLYEFDCGALSGWQYRVNGVFLSFASSEYKVKSGDKIEFLYTCDMGHDIGNTVY